MPVTAKIVNIISTIDFDGEVTDKLLNEIKNILIDFSDSGKLFIYKVC
jgi:hypothetical protein